MAAKTVFYFIGILLFVGIQAQVSIVYDVFSNSKINSSALIEITGSVTINYLILLKCFVEQCFQLFSKCCAMMYTMKTIVLGLILCIMKV